MANVVSTWADDMKVLAAVYAGLQNEEAVRLDQLASATGLEMEPIYWALDRLQKGDFLSQRPPMHGVGLSAVVQRVHMTERGLRTAGVWPSLDEFQAGLVRAFEQRAESEPDPKAKVQWIAMAKALAGEVGKAILREGVGNVL